MFESSQFATDAQHSPFHSSDLRLPFCETGSSLITQAGFGLVILLPQPPVLRSQECTTRTGVSRVLMEWLLGNTISSCCFNHL